MYLLYVWCISALLLPSLAVVVDHYSTNGQRCLTLCKPHKDYFYCIYGYSNSKWGKCSPRSGYTVKNEQCASPCTYNTHKNKRYCKTLNGKTEECGEVKCATDNAQERHYSRKGDECIGKCGELTYKGKYYCWRVKGGWDYCSRYPNTVRATSSTPCRPDHDCDFHGKTDTWCYTDDKGHKDYCGIHKTCASSLDINVEPVCEEAQPLNETNNERRKRAANPFPLVRAERDITGTGDINSGSDPFV